MTDTMPLIPDDEFDHQLLENVHPPNWINPTPEQRYNLIVIGAGTAGLVTAAGAAGLGAKVALIEKNLMGGDCLNAGCVPSKALIASARQIAAIRDSKSYGIKLSGEMDIQFSEIMQRMRKIRAEISQNDSANRFRKLGVDVFIGEAKFVDSQHVQVANKKLHGARIAICTGARATALPIPGLQDVDYLTNESLFTLTKLPQRMAIIGAGPIGCEMAQCFSRFGSDVTLLEAAEQILPREDDDAAQLVQQALRDEGVTILSEVQVQHISQKADQIIIRYSLNDGVEELKVDQLLLSVGRKPNIEGLDLEAAGVEYDLHVGITVDDLLRTSQPVIFAAGDVCSDYKFTHSADYQARIVIGNALFGKRSRASRLLIPWCTYTDPEIAHVGLYEEEAIEKGIPVQTFIQNFSEVDRAVLDGAIAGFVKVHIKKGSDKILGATIVAPHAGDLISEITLAMSNGIGLTGIGNTIHPYPTLADAIRKLGDQYNRTRLTPFVRKMSAAWLRWCR